METETAEVGFKPECGGRSCGFGCEGRITDHLAMQLDGRTLAEDVVCMYVRSWAGRLSLAEIQEAVWEAMDKRDKARKEAAEEDAERGRCARRGIGPR